MNDIGLEGPSIPRKMITLRISNIPGSTTKDHLCQTLEGLGTHWNGTRDTAKRRRENNIHSFSLAPSPSAVDHHRYQVATVTFKEIPLALKSCVSSYDTLHLSVRGTGSEFEAAVDSHFRGLTPLNDTPNPSVDIIAVTGLAGHAFGSWKSHGCPEMWLRDFIPDDLLENGYNARILVYGYDTKLVGSTSDASIYEISKQFLEAVKDTRRQKTEAHRPIILIGHSLGGLVIKEALMEADKTYHDIFRSCYGILFFGVPNRGLEITQLASMVKGQPNSHLVRDLCGRSQFLDLLHRSFCHHFRLEDSKIISVYETKDTETVQTILETGEWARGGKPVRMVTRQSAIHSTDGRNIPLDADHSTLVKFRSRTDLNYQTIRNEILDLTRDAPKIIENRFAVQRGEELTEKEKECLRSLIPDNNDPTLKIPPTKVYSGTCEWLLTTEEFMDWRFSGNTSKLLWISGHPGTGKTVLMSFLLRELRKRSTVAYFFCDDKDEGRRTAAAILKSLVYQLLHGNVSLLGHIMQEFERFRDGEQKSWSFDTLWEIFCNIARDTEARPVYCLIDALDECEETEGRDISRSGLLSRIKDLYSSGTGCQIRLIITSRPYADIQTCLKVFGTISLGQTTTKQDISRFITEKLRVAFQDKFSDEFTEKVARWLCQEAEGMFLWVALVIKDLSSCFLEAEVDTRLETLPKGLYGYYDSILGRIPSEHRERAKQMLMWIVYAARPMTLVELNTALAISTASTTLNIKNGQSHNLKLELETRCGMLIEFREGSNETVHLTHQSVKEFLTSETEVIEQSRFKLIHHSAFYVPRCIANSLLGRNCIIHLLSEDFVNIQIPPRGRVNLTGYPLLEYSTMNWAHHLQHIEPLDLNMINALDFFRFPSIKQFRTWARLYMSLGNIWSMSMKIEPESFHPIHAAAYFGIPSLTSLLLQKGVDVNVADLKGRTPLHWAVNRGRKEMVRFLVERGANMSTENIYGLTPLNSAAMYGYEEIARFLVEYGAGVDTKNAFSGW
ncbi:hypothetical protein Q9L58_007664 [Maublancomyces gigas]|uniref:Uncharacterized protein n=1 Tax=Discina gigas TaxID=1032678 RepID=A0ABR3GCA2_9PEZI